MFAIKHSALIPDHKKLMISTKTFSVLEHKPGLLVLFGILCSKYVDCAMVTRYADKRGILVEIDAEIEIHSVINTHIFPFTLIQ